MKIPPIANSFTLMWILNGFVKFRNFNIREKKKTFRSSPQMPSIAFLSIQKITPFLEDLKMVTPSTTSILWSTSLQGGKALGCSSVKTSKNSLNETKI
jgi:hypothetical protein